MRDLRLQTSRPPRDSEHHATRVGSDLYNFKAPQLFTSAVHEAFYLFFSFICFTLLATVVRRLLPQTFAINA